MHSKKVGAKNLVAFSNIYFGFGIRRMITKCKF